MHLSTQIVQHLLKLSDAAGLRLQRALHLLKLRGDRLYDLRLEPVCPARRASLPDLVDPAVLVVPPVPATL